jgi:hypothetical protein
MLEIFKEKVIKYTEPYFVTQGLVNDIDFELRVKPGKFGETDYIYVLKYIIDYITEENAVITPNQTISFNSWILAFVRNDENFLDIYERHPTTHELVSGCENSIEIMNSQIEICETYSSKLTFTKVNQNIVISDGVLDGRLVEAVKYEAPEHMSGWYITTDLYNDDINTLQQIQLPDLMLKRPELVKFLALDNGFRFVVDKENIEVWFDEEVLE